MPAIAPARLALCLLVMWPASGWSFTCSVQGGGANLVLGERDADMRLAVTLRCTRPNMLQGNAMSYRIKADAGNHPQPGQPGRALRLGASPHHLAYALSRAPADCTSTTNWTAPTYGNGQVIVGTLAFGLSLEASATWSYCVRVLAPAHGQPWPAPGIYHDMLRLFAQYPAHDTGALTAPVAIPLTVHVPARCTLSQPGPLNLHYPSFSRFDVIARNRADLRCSTDLPWSATLDENRGRLLGLDYTLDLLGPALASSGKGTGFAQPLEVTGRIPAGQPGACSGGTCTARRTHTLTISY